MGYSVDPIAEGKPFGGIVTGLSVDALDDPHVGQSLRELWDERGVLVFRGLPSDPDTHMRLSACFGDIEAHPHNPGRKGVPLAIADVYAGDEDGDIYDLGDGDLRVGWLPWHFDLCYSDKINRGGILRAVELPPAGGKTGFIDLIQAWTVLPEDLQRRVEGLSMVYEMEFDASRMRFCRPPNIRLVRQQERVKRFAGRAHELPRGIHPIVYRQGGSGAPIVHVSPYFAAGIEGMETPEGDALAQELLARVTDEALAYYHDWQPEDYVLWDNWRMIHCGTGVPVGQRRHLQRVAIAGDYRLGRIERDDERSERSRVVV